MIGMYKPSSARSPDNTSVDSGIPKGSNHGFLIKISDSIGFRGSEFSPSHGGGDEEVVEPVGVILEAIEVVERRAPRRVVAARASPVGVEIPLQSQGAHGETGGIGRAVQRAHRIETPVLMVHEPIEGIGGAMRTR